jgi:hypothetical protein
MCSYTSQLWVFTEDLNFSSSLRNDEREDPTRAMKILWKSIDTEDDAVAQRGQLSVEQITLPTEIFDSISNSLQRSSALLPSSTKTFNGWQVGLLERFRLRRKPESHDSQVTRSTA